MDGSFATIANPALESGYNGYIYVIGMKDGNAGFFNYKGANIAGFRAYMPYRTGTPSLGRMRIVFDDMEDAIIAAEADVNGNGAIYNLSGQRVSKAVKGIYIVGGKKIIVK